MVQNVIGSVKLLYFVQINVYYFIYLKFCVLRSSDRAVSAGFLLWVRTQLLRTKSCWIHSPMTEV